MSHSVAINERDFKKRDDVAAELVALCLKRACLRCAENWQLACPHKDVDTQDWRGATAVGKVEEAKKLLDDAVGQLLWDRNTDKGRIAQLEAELKEARAAGVHAGKQMAHAETGEAAKVQGDMGSLFMTAHLMARVYGYNPAKHGDLWQWIQALGEGKETLKKPTLKKQPSGPDEPDDVKAAMDAAKGNEK
jgi:hypothetical protein